MVEAFGERLERDGRAPVPADELHGVVRRELGESLLVQRPGEIHVVSPAHGLVPAFRESGARRRVEAQLGDERRPWPLRTDGEVERDPPLSGAIPRVDEPVARADVCSDPFVRSSARSPEDRLQRGEGAERRDRHVVSRPVRSASMEPREDRLDGAESGNDGAYVASQSYRRPVGGSDVVREANGRLRGGLGRHEATADRVRLERADERSACTVGEIGVPIREHDVRRRGRRLGRRRS